MAVTTVYRVSGKDAFGCRAQLKVDGFVFDGEMRAWYGTQENIDKFKSRGFRVKVFFNALEEQSEGIDS